MFVYNSKYECANSLILNLRFEDELQMIYKTLNIKQNCVLGQHINMCISGHFVIFKRKQKLIL